MKNGKGVGHQNLVRSQIGDGSGVSADSGFGTAVRTRVTAPAVITGCSRRLLLRTVAGLA